MNEFVPTITNKIDILLGVLVGILTYFFGEYYMLFVGFFVLNVVDYITGVMKARIAGVSNSHKGFNGLLKKGGYWIIILLAFLMTVIFNSLGNAMGMDFGFSILLVYGTLGSLILNELRSIFENLVQCGYHPPKILTKGLEVANKLINEDEEDEEDNDYGGDADS